MQEQKEIMVIENENSEMNHNLLIWACSACLAFITTNVTHLGGVIHTPVRMWLLPELRAVYLYESELNDSDDY